MTGGPEVTRAASSGSPATAGDEAAGGAGLVRCSAPLAGECAVDWSDCMPFLQPGFRRASDASDLGGWRGGWRAFSNFYSNYLHPPCVAVAIVSRGSCGKWRRRRRRRSGRSGGIGDAIDGGKRVPRVAHRLVGRGGRWVAIRDSSPDNCGETGGTDGDLDDGGPAFRGDRFRGQGRTPSGARTARGRQLLEEPESEQLASASLDRVSAHAEAIPERPGADPAALRSAVQRVVLEPQELERGGEDLRLQRLDYASGGERQTVRSHNVARRR